MTHICDHCKKVIDFGDAAHAYNTNREQIDLWALYEIIRDQFTHDGIFDRIDNPELFGDTLIAIVKASEKIAKQDL